MKRKEWKLAASALDVVLVKPTDEDELWMPDIDSLLLRSQVRLRLADKTGALEDALTVTETLALNHPKTPRAIVLKAQVRISQSLSQSVGSLAWQALFAMGELEAALMYFQRVR